MCKEAFFAGALVMLRQVEDPRCSYAQQRRRLRSLAGEVREFQVAMALEEAKRNAQG